MGREEELLCTEIKWQALLNLSLGLWTKFGHFLSRSVAEVDWNWYHSAVGQTLLSRRRSGVLQSAPASESQRKSLYFS